MFSEVFTNKPNWELRRSAQAALRNSLSATHSVCHSYLCCFSLALISRMIRRNPTLIAMSDADVQDVRNILAKKQAEGVKSPSSDANAKGKQVPPPQPPAATVHVTDEAKRRREERLGITH